MKLYLIETNSVGLYYVGATDPTGAQERLCKYLGRNFTEKAIKSISLFAEANDGDSIFNSQYHYIP